MELYFKLNKNDDLGLFSQPAINHEECKSNHLSPIPGLGQIHLPLTDGSSVKCDVKKLFCFSFEFNENCSSCSYLCVIKLHQVYLNSNEKVFHDNFNEWPVC